jgi:CubicO group peptidase (beta-lactamase class C family)
MPRLNYIALPMSAALLASCGGSSSPNPAPTPASTPAATPAPIPAPSASPANATAFIDYAIAAGARAVVINQDGAITAERYAGTGAIGRGEALASGTKSFTCTLAVIAEATYNFDPLQPLGSVVPPWGPGGTAPQQALKTQIRAIDLLGLTGGLAFSGAAGADLNTVDSYRQAIFAQSRATPNTATIYTPNSQQAFSAVFELISGGQYNADGSITGGADGITTLEQFVFTPLGIRATAWARDVNNKPNFAGGAEMTVRDWARYGQLIAGNGVIGGIRLAGLPEAPMRRCLTYSSGAFQGYGLGWWLNRPVGNSYVESRDSLPLNQALLARWRAGGKFAPSAPDDLVMAVGLGGRKLYVVPSRRISIAVIGYSGDDELLLQQFFG